MTYTTARWSHITTSHRLDRSSQALSVIGENAYVFGGELVPRKPVDNQVDVINLGSRPGNLQTIHDPTEAPCPRVGSPSTTAQNGLWIFSGRGGLEMKPVEELGNLWRYDPIKSQWSLIRPADSTAAYPEGRSYHCITSDDHEKIYVHSGCPESGRLSDLWEFDIEARTWRELPTAPGPARGGASILYSGGKLYRINGFDGKIEQGGSIDVFDINKSSWSSINYLPDGIQGPEARSVGAFLPIVIHGKTHLVTMFGERDPSALGHAGAGKMLADAWAWSVEQESWHKIVTAGEAPEARGWFDADMVKSGERGTAIIVHGGLNEDNKRLGDVWMLSFD